MATRYFYHPEKALVASLSHVEGDLYRLEIWRSLIQNACEMKLLCGAAPSPARRMSVISEIITKPAAFEALEDFLEYDADLAAHHNGDAELELGFSGGG